MGLPLAGAGVGGYMLSKGLSRSFSFGSDCSDDGWGGGGWGSDCSGGWGGDCSDWNGLQILHNYFHNITILNTYILYLFKGQINI